MVEEKKMKPYFSIIIPLAPSRGAEVLESIKRLDFPKSQYEVIVEKGTNPSRNRNNGARKAKGKILCFLDDDAIVPKDLLKSAKIILNRHGATYVLAKQYGITNYETDILGGPQLTPTDDKWFAKACGEVLASKFGSLSMSKRYRKEKEDFNADENSLTSAIMFVRADAFKHIGGFDEKMYPGEDPLFLAEAKRKGYRICYSPEIFIWHRRRSNIIKYAEQMFSYGKVRLEKEKKAKSDGKKGLLFYIPMLFALYAISCLFFNIAFLNTTIFGINVNIFLAIYFLVALFASMGKGLLNLITMPFIFFLTHFCYGFGMLEGWLDRCFK